MNKYDMHTHILPGIDDGAKDIKTSLLLAEKLKSDGVTHIALTPHYYSDKESLADFLSKREEAARLLSAHPLAGVTYILGSEAYITEYIFNNSSLQPLCYAGTKNLLVEFPYSTNFSQGGGDLLYKLMSNYGVVPVIAHIERYQSLMKNEDLLWDLRQMGCKMQINLDSLSLFSQKRRLLKFMKQGFVDVVGTDTHSLLRGADFCTGLGIISKKLGEEYVNTIAANSETLIFGE